MALSIDYTYLILVGLEANLKLLVTSMILDMLFVIKCNNTLNHLIIQFGYSMRS